VAIFGARLTLASRYADLLCSAGVERGLIGPREAERIWTRHLLNSAAVAPLIPVGAHVVDVGSGAGLPGVPIALARADVHVTLTEPMARRVQFLAEVVADLALPLQVVRARAEELTTRYDVVVARAVAPLARLVALAVPLLAAGGQLLALKGRSVHDEVTDARAALADSGGTVDVRHVGDGEWGATVAVVTIGGSPARPRVANGASSRGGDER